MTEMKKLSIHRALTELKMLQQRMKGQQMRLAL